MTAEDRIVLRQYLGWALVLGGLAMLLRLQLAPAPGAGGPEAAAVGGSYLAGVARRTIALPFQLVLAVGLVALPLHLVALCALRGKVCVPAYARFAGWAQVLFTSLGFLGTIIGVSLAVAGLPAAMQAEDPGALIAGLSTAFDTTFLGLSAAILLLAQRWGLELWAA